MTITVTELSTPSLAVFCQCNHIQKLALFGSALGGDLRPESDLDLLVEFAPGTVPGWKFFELQAELTQLLGRQVDLNTADCLSPYFREEVREIAETLYDASR